MRKLLALLLLLPLLAHAGSITGNIQTASSGAVVNGTLTFTLNQFAVVSGTAQVVATGVQCYTSTAGAITGEPDPQTAPVLSVNLGSGTLAAGTYFVKYTYFDGTGESLPSPEASVTLVSQGTVIVAVPAIQPANATGWRVYISAATGTETRQSSQTGFAASYQQTAALSAGTALPGSNTSACSIRFTDEMIPSTTYYTINLVNAQGSKIAGYPISQARFYGGTNGSVNVSSGWPVSIGGVIWPSPIVSTPNGNAGQSISGPLNYGAVGQTSTNTGNQVVNGNVSVGGTTTHTGPASFAKGFLGPDPWADVTANGLVGDGSTDNTAAFNTLIASACSSGTKYLWFPSPGNFVFKSKPNAIHCGLYLVGPISLGANYSFGSFITMTYNAGTNSEPFLSWDGANATTQGNGGGIWGVNILVNAANTAGALINANAAGGCTNRAGDMIFYGFKLGGGGGGAEGYGFDIDGTGCTGAGTQGMRDFHIDDVLIFGATQKALRCQNCVHFYWGNGATSPGGGVGDAQFTGLGAGTAASTDIVLSGISIFGNLQLDQVTQFAFLGIVTGTLSCTANTTNSTLMGDISTISGCINQASYYTAQSGASLFGVSGTLNLGRDLCIGINLDGGATTCFRRNNGSGTGTNLAISMDAFSTIPFNLDTTNGLSTSKPITSTLAAGNVATTLNGYERTGNTVRVTADFTTANNTNLQTITGLSWTMPATALNWSFHCSILYSQATAAVADQFGIQAATNSPTNIQASGIVYTSTSASTAGNIATLNTTTATPFVTFTPSATATNFIATLQGTIELPASANTINIMVQTSAGADAVTVKRGSYCMYTP